MGCLRLIFFQIWKVLLAAVIAMVLTRVDGYIDRNHGGTTAGRAWQAYRSRGKKKPS